MPDMGKPEPGFHRAMAQWAAVLVHRLGFLFFGRSQKESGSYGGQPNVPRLRRSFVDQAPGHFEKIHGFMQLFHVA